MYIEEICHGFEGNMHEPMPEFGEYCPSLRGQYSPNEGIDSCILAEKKHDIYSLYHD